MHGKVAFEVLIRGKLTRNEVTSSCRAGCVSGRCGVVRVWTELFYAALIAVCILKFPPRDSFAVLRRQDWVEFHKLPIWKTLAVLRTRARWNPLIPVRI